MLIPTLRFAPNGARNSTGAGAIDILLLRSKYPFLKIPRLRLQDTIN